MLEISRIYEIIIAMFYNHHALHISMQLWDQKAIIRIDTLDIFDGWLSVHPR